MKNIGKFFAVIFIALVCNTAVLGTDNRVVATIKPIHSLAAALMEGVGSPYLLIKGFDSVHGYQLKPSDAQIIQDAKVVIWVGPELETTLKAPVASLTENSIVVEVSELHGMTLLQTRETSELHHDEEDEDHEEEEDHEGEETAEEDHAEEKVADADHVDEEAEEDHEGEEDHEADEDHESEEEHEGDEDHEGEEAHGHGNFDMHVWLDTHNAKVMATELAEALQVAMPEHASVFETNLEKTLSQLEALESELLDLAAPITEFPYMVFHDAYQYLERNLNLHNVGAVTTNPNRAPGAKKVRELREDIHDAGAICIFREPQFNPEIIDVIAAGTQIRSGVLDPLGADIEAGPDAYSQIMRNMVQSLRNCLTGES